MEVTDRPVAVLLATHQGIAFLEPLLASILSQWGHGLRLIVRDDGSTDGTREMLRDHAARDRRVELYLEDHVGLPGAFFRLLEREGGRADAVFFADQDDIWMPGKIAAGVRALDRMDARRPGLVTHRLEIVDADLTPKGLSPLWPRQPTFGNALVENIATGCASAMNREASQRVLRRLPVQGVTHHDWWCYLTVAAFGVVSFDPEPRVLYRLHGGNAVGQPLGQAQTVWGRLSRLRAGGFYTSIAAQARAFKSCHGPDLPVAEHPLIDSVAGLDGSRGSVRRLLARTDIYRQRSLDNLVFRLGLRLHGLGLAS